MNNQNPKSKYKSHSCCWEQEGPACGQPIDKHTQCCLCPEPSPIESREKKCCEDYNGTKDITNSCVFCKTYIPESSKCGDYKCTKNHNHLGVHWEKETSSKHTHAHAGITEANCNICTSLPEAKSYEWDFRKSLEKILFYSKSDYCVGCGLTLDGLDNLLSLARKSEREKLREVIERKKEWYSGEGNKPIRDVLDDILSALKGE